MTDRNNWIRVGSIIVIVSAVLYFTIAYIFDGFEHIVPLLILFVGLMGHLFGNYRVLFQFAMTRHRMSNRLHVYNKVLMIVNVAILVLHLVVITIFSYDMNEEGNLLVSSIYLLIMLINIIYQENNTNTFIKKFPIQIPNRKKKSFNQLVGVMVSSISISVLWIDAYNGHSITVVAYLFIVLLLIQNSLSYTTYGQSRYWNFTYESVAIVYVISLGVYHQVIPYIIVGFVLAIVFAIRQWKTLEYKKVSITVGVILLIASTALFILLQDQLVVENISDSLIHPFVVLLAVFVITYIVQEPKFYKKIMKQ